MIAGISQRAAPISDDLDLFFGDANPAEARVYARLNFASDADRSTPVRIEGHIAGPECRFAKTLPAKIPLVDRGPGIAEPLAEAVIPDPCFWTPETPFLYLAKLVVHVGERRETLERSLGIRRLGVRERSLYLDGRRWVARGAVLPAAADVDPRAARATEAVLRVRTADDLICAEASSQGVPLFVDLTDRHANVDAEILRLGRWPAVFVVVLGAKSAIGDELRKRSPNLLLAVQAAVDEPLSAPDWAQLIVCPFERLAEFCDWSTTHRRQIPTIVSRALNDETSGVDLDAARRGCDQLQSDAAEFGDFAGYLIELHR